MPESEYPPRFTILLLSFYPYSLDWQAKCYYFLPIMKNDSVFIAATLLFIASFTGLAFNRSGTGALVCLALLGVSLLGISYSLALRHKVKHGNDGQVPSSWHSLRKIFPITHNKTTDNNIFNLSLAADGENIWNDILDNFLTHKATGFGFKYVDHPGELEEFACFEDYNPHLFMKILYTPPGKTEDRAGDKIAIFECSTEALQRIRAVDRKSWDSTNQQYPTDELVFFSGDNILAVAVHKNDSIVFQNLSAVDLELLKGISPAIADGLKEQ